MPEKVPVTILTGFLGSGKTTLLNRILSESHGLRIAVIENEFGEIGIDQDMVINADEEVFEMNNGCICCTVRGDLIRILNNLARRREKFDRVVLETTGLADPGPVAQTFFVDDDVKDEFVLEGIVTLVDAKHVEQHFDDSEEVVAQIAFADMIVLNKCDLISEEERSQLADRIGGLNKMAKILPAEMADVPIEKVLDIGGFDLDRALTINNAFLDPEYPFEWAGVYSLEKGLNSLKINVGPDPTMSLNCYPVTDNPTPEISELAETVFRSWAGDGTSVSQGDKITPSAERLIVDLDQALELELDIKKTGEYVVFTEHTPEEFDLTVKDNAGLEVLATNEQYFDAGHTHDDTVGSVALELTGELDSKKINDWFSVLLQTEGPNIFRMKGILAIEGSDARMVFQGVHMLFDSQPGEPWGTEPRHNRLVFIGRELDEDYLKETLKLCRA